MQIVLEVHPIATAPKDREVLLLRKDAPARKAWWLEIEGCWIVDGDDESNFDPTHWSELPTLPKEASECQN